MARRSRRSEYQGRPYVARSSFEMELPPDELRRSLEAFDTLRADRGMGRSPMSVLDRVVGVLRGRVYAPPYAKRSFGGRFAPVLTGLRVSWPTQVRFCVQRHLRREVLFARGVAGRRGSAPGPYRRKESSNWRC